MPDFTENLKLKMPGQTDYFDIDDFNNNAQIIDEKYQEIKSQTAAKLSAEKFPDLLEAYLKQMYPEYTMQDARGTKTDYSDNIAAVIPSTFIYDSGNCVFYTFLSEFYDPKKNDGLLIWADGELMTVTDRRTSADSNNVCVAKLNSENYVIAIPGRANINSLVIHVWHKPQSSGGTAAGAATAIADGIAAVSQQGGSVTISDGAVSDTVSGISEKIEEE